jgi:hypothetical protein
MATKTIITWRTLVTEPGTPGYPPMSRVELDADEADALIERGFAALLDVPPASALVLPVGAPVPTADD